MKQKSLHPVCVCASKAKLVKQENVLTCSNNGCVHSHTGHGFKILNGVPIIISEQLCDTVCNSNNIKTYVQRSVGRMAFFRDLFSTQSKVTVENSVKFVNAVKEKGKKAKILIIGAAEQGSGTEYIWNDDDIERFGIDIYCTPTVDVICDAHYIPYPDKSFDGVWVQAVLEHVLEPQKVVSEIHRVLVEGGVVYAETPFMQQVHEGAYDFTRFTVLGHRYLFRDFEALDFGGNKGAEVVLVWSMKYFVWALTRSRNIARLSGLLASIILRPFGLFLSARSLFDSSSGAFFFGRKSEIRIAHKEVIKLYRGHL